MSKNKWQLHRAGLLNFWYYDDEEFQFSNGKLLLRGSNGSGKSVTMQSFIPVLLDGKKTPDRLDPFGSKARRMEDYLLGEKDVVDRDERTGYLYLEYKRENSNQYLTTGIGLKAKRHSNLDFWGFIIHDNHRIGHDFMLYKTEYSAEEGKQIKVPLTRRELENRLENSGKVVRGQKEYMDLVNKHIFGFESIEDYEELIKLLIQLRSPKLSKEFKPTVIYEILNDSLPGLSDDELRPLSDTIENMDQTKQQLEQLMRDQAALNRLTKHYDAYNRYVLVEKADGLLKSNKKLNTLQKDKKELEAEVIEEQDNHRSKNDQLRHLRLEEELLKEEESKLKEHDVFKTEEEKQKLDNLIKRNNEMVIEKEKGINHKKSKERNLHTLIVNEEEKQSTTEKNINELLDELEIFSEEVAFFNHMLASSEFKKNYQESFVFDLWKKESKDYLQRIDHILKTLLEYSKVKDNHHDLDKELGEIRKELDIKQYEMQKWDKVFGEEKNQLLDEIHQWQKNNTELLFADEEIHLIAQRVVQLYDIYRYDDVREPVTKSYQKFHSSIQSKIAKNQQNIDNKLLEISAKEKELLEWRAKKDPEPNRHQDTLEARENLGRNIIPYIPFYAAVEFYEEVPMEKRERIEAAITEIGLLDALIVNKKYHSLDVKGNKIINANPKIMVPTLADFLYPTPIDGIDISKEDIDNVLRSILIENAAEAQTIVLEDGNFQIGIMRGHAPKALEAIYIGKEARKKYRLQEITRIEVELTNLKAEKLELEKIAMQIKSELDKLTEEFNIFPLDKDVNEAYNTLQDLQKEIKFYEEEVGRKNEKVKELLEKLQSIRNILRELTHDLTLTLSLEVFERARASMNDYIEKLRDLESESKDWTNSKEKLEQYNLNRDEVILDIDEMKGELNVLQYELEKLSAQLKQVLERLAELGAEEIQARIAKVITRLKELPDQISGTSKTIGELEHKILDVESKILENKRQLQSAEELYNKWLQIFIEENQLQLVDQENQENQENWSSEVDILKRAKYFWSQYNILITDTNQDRNKLLNRLNDSFYQEQGILIEYRLTQETILEITELSSFEGIEDNEFLQIQVEQLREKARRIILLIEYNGKRVSPFFVRNQMIKDIELQEQILNEKDRELYEEIILNSVGRILRGRINRAEKWVEKINQLMGERDTSSGLTFSIRWKPRTADVEDELDTKDLVELLRLDPRLLKDEDMDSITRHFKSKITRAKELLEDKGNGETLHQIIKEMLDYRKWFSFTLFYRKEGEQRKELTNNVFYIFSGGEKAMAMYIPLFSAAYSRYLEAREDAPFIISLDEAFAGVDDNNIRDMFDLVEKLGFNYILNSQALWGDYDTVSSLSICELVRPKNAPFVTVVRYIWDGKSRYLLNQLEALQQEEPTIANKL